MDGFSDNPSAMTGGRRWWRATKAHPAYRELSKNGRMMAMLVALRVSQGNDWCAYEDEAMAEDLGTDIDCEGRCRPGRRGMADLVEAGFLQSAERFGRWYLATPGEGSERCENSNIRPKLVGKSDQNWSKNDQNWSDPRPKLVGKRPKLVGPIRKMVTNGNCNSNNRDSAAVAVVSLLGSDELIDHPNATPERLAWVAETAPSKASPAGWAASAIRDGYEVPAPSDADRQQERIRRTRSAIAEFDALPAAEQDAIRLAALRQFPNLDPKNASHAGSIRAACARVLLETQQRAV